MHLNKSGYIAYEEWKKSEHIRKEVYLDEFIIMPNHIHGIIYLINNKSNSRRGDRPVTPTGPQQKSIGSLLAGYKSSVTSRINKTMGTPYKKIWQRNYYDRIIRNNKELFRIRKYIRDNPTNWENDKFY